MTPEVTELRDALAEVLRIVRDRTPLSLLECLNVVHEDVNMVRVNGNARRRLVRALRTLADELSSPYLDFEEGYWLGQAGLPVEACSNYDQRRGHDQQREDCRK